MADNETVIIGVQARLGSTRLKHKTVKEISGKPCIQYVIEKADKVARYINRVDKYRIKIEVALLVPDEEYQYWYSHYGEYYTIIAGDMKNVLSRYLKLVRGDVSYIVRLTGDCPFLCAMVLHKAILTSRNHRLDYLSNTDPKYRTAPDGEDIEVMSKEALLFCGENAKSDFDKEHVTTVLKSSAPGYMRIGCLINDWDKSNIKISLDTEIDLKRMDNYANSAKEKNVAARKKGFFVYAV